jgi:aspartyl-tRNA(Asn)/glutamyl-tRNA(Gln) amidotransferase subunit A
VAPSVDVDDLDVRERLILFTYPFNCLGWPALALPCGPAEDGRPASVQLAGPDGADALVLAAGELLERSLNGLET